MMMTLLPIAMLLLLAALSHGASLPGDIEPRDDGLSLEGLDLGVEPEMDFSSNLIDEPFARASVEDELVESLTRSKRDGVPNIDTFAMVRDALDIVAKAEKMSTKNEHKIRELSKAVGLTALSLTGDTLSASQQKHILGLIQKEAAKFGGKSVGSGRKLSVKPRVMDRSMVLDADKSAELDVAEGDEDAEEQLLILQ